MMEQWKKSWINIGINNAPKKYLFTITINFSEHFNFQTEKLLEWSQAYEK